MASNDASTAPGPSSEGSPTNPVILILASGPLVVMLYWMWRVRLRQNVRGLVTARLIEAPGSAGA